MLLCLLGTAFGNGVVFVGQINTVPPMKSVYLMKVRVNDDNIAVDTIADTGNGLGFQANGKPHVYVAGTTDVNIESIEDNIEVNSHDRTRYDSRFISIIGEDGVDFSANNAGTPDGADGGDVTISAAADVIATAGTDVDVTAEENVYVRASREIDLTARDRDVQAFAGLDVDINAHDFVYFNASTGDIEIQADFSDVQVVGQENILLKTEVEDIQFCATLRDANFIAKEAHRWCAKDGGISIFTGRELGGFDPVLTPSAQDGIRVVSASPGGGTVISSATRASGDTLNVPAPSENGIIVHAAAQISTKEEGEMVYTGGVIVYTEDATAHNQPTELGGSVQFMAYQTDGGIDMRTGATQTNADAQDNNIVFHASEGNVLFSSASNRNMPSTNDAGQHVMFHASPEDDGSDGGSINFWTSTTNHDLLNDEKVGKVGNVLFNMREGNGYLLFGVGAATPPPETGVFDNHIIIHADGASASKSNIFIGTGASNTQDPVVPQDNGVIFRAANPEGGVVVASQSDVPAANPDGITFNAHFFEDVGGENELANDRGGILLAVGPVPIEPDELTGDLDMNILVNTRGNSPGGIMIATGFLNDYTVKEKDIISLSLAETGGQVFQSSATSEPVLAQDYSIIFQSGGPQNSTVGSILITSGRNDEIPIPGGANPADNSIIILTDAAATASPPVGGMYIATGFLDSVPIDTQGGGTKDLIVNALPTTSDQDRDSVGGVAWATGNCHIDVATDNDISFVAESEDSGMTVSIGDSGPNDISVVVQTGSHLTLVPEAVKGGIVLNTGDLRKTEEDALPNDDVSPNDIFLRAAGGGGVCLGTGNTFSVDCATSNDITLNAAVREYGNNAISPSSIPSIMVATGSGYGVRQTGQIIFNTVQSGGTEGSILLYTNNENGATLVDATDSEKDVYVGARSDGMVLIGTGDFTQFKGSQNDVYLAVTQEEGGALLNVGVALPIQEGNLIVNAFNDFDGDKNPTGSIGILAGFQSDDLSSAVGGGTSSDIVVDVFNPESTNGQLTFATGPFNPRVTVGYNLIHIHAGSTHDNDAGGILVYAGDTVRNSAMQLSKATPFDVQISAPGTETTVNGGDGGITLAAINSETLNPSKAIAPADDLLRIQSMEQSAGGITIGTGVIEEPTESSIILQAQIGGVYIVAAGTPELNRPSTNDIQIQSPSNSGGVIITSADVATTPGMAFIPDVANAIQVVAPGGAESGILYHTGSQTTVPVQENDIYMLSGEGDVNFTVETVDGIILFDALNSVNTHGIVSLNSDIVEWNTSADVNVMAQTTNVKVEAGNNVSLWSLKSAQFVAENDDILLVAPVGGLSFGASKVAGVAPDDGDVNFLADGDLFVEAGDYVKVTSTGGRVLGRASHGIQIGAGVAPSRTGLATVGSTFIDALDRVDILAASAFELSVRGTSPLFPVQRTVTSDSLVTQPGFISVAAVAGPNNQAAIEIAASTTVNAEEINGDTNGNVEIRADVRIQYQAVDDVSFELLEGANTGNGIQVIAQDTQYLGASNVVPPSRPQGTIDLVADANMDIVAGQRVSFKATDDIGVRAETGGVLLIASPQNYPAPLRDQVQLISDKRTTLHAITNLQFDSEFGDISFSAYDGAIQVLSDSLQADCQSIANIDGRINFRACGSNAGQAFQYSRATEGNPGISNTAERYLQVYGGKDGVLLEAVPAKTDLQDLNPNDKAIKILASEVINGAAVDSLIVMAESVDVLAEKGGSISILSSSQPHAIPDASNIFVAADKAVEFRADFSNENSELSLQTQGNPNAPIVFGTKRGVTQIISSENDRSAPSPSNVGDLHLKSFANDVKLLAQNDVTFTSAGPASFTSTGSFTFTTSTNLCDKESFTTEVGQDQPGNGPAQSCSMFQMDAGGRTEIRAAHGQKVALTVVEDGFAFVASSSGESGNVIVRGGADVILSLPSTTTESSDVLISATDGGIWNIATDTTNLDFGLEVIEDTVFHAGVSIADTMDTALTTGMTGGVVDPTTFNRLGSLGNWQDVAGLAFQVGTGTTENQRTNVETLGDVEVHGLVTMTGSLRVLDTTTILPESFDAPLKVSFVPGDMYPEGINFGDHINDKLINADYAGSGDAQGEDQAHFGGTTVSFSEGEYILFATDVQMRSTTASSADFRHSVALVIDELALSGDQSGLEVTQGNIELRNRDMTEVTSKYVTAEQIATGAQPSFVDNMPMAFSHMQVPVSSANPPERESVVAFDAANGGAFLGGLGDEGVMSRVIMAGPAVFGSNSTNWEQDILRYPSPTQSIRAYNTDGSRALALRCNNDEACLDNPMHAMVTVNHASSGGGGGLVVSGAVEGQTAFRSNGGVRMEYGFIYTGGDTTLGSDPDPNMHMFGNPYAGAGSTPRAPEANRAQLKGGANELIIIRAKTISLTDPTGNSSDFFLDARGSIGDAIGGIVLPYSDTTRNIIENAVPSNILCMDRVDFTLGVCQTGATTEVLANASDTCGINCDPTIDPTLAALSGHCTCVTFEK